ncbi:unnamed protein product [Urochloa humidicola]
MGTKELVLKEIFRLVEACEGKEDLWRTNRGQCALKQVDGFLEDFNWGTNFDENILTWHYATDMFFSQKERLANVAPIVEATEAVSNYMMFLLVEHPYMLPGRVRPRVYENAREDLQGHYKQEMSDQIKAGHYRRIPLALIPGAKLTKRLLDDDLNAPKVLQVVFGVWVEMLCYAAHNCSRDSHAKQLNIGSEFITVVWLLTTVTFNRLNCEKEWFDDGTKKFFFSPARRRNFPVRRFRSLFPL